MNKKVWRLLIKKYRKLVLAGCDTRSILKLSKAGLNSVFIFFHVGLELASPCPFPMTREMGRKTSVWIFQATILRDCSREDLNMDKQEKPQKRN